MTNASIKNVFAGILVLMVSVSFSMGAFAIVAHADDSGSYGGGYDTGSYGGGYDSGSSYGGGYDSGSYGSGYDTGSYAGGYAGDTSYSPDTTTYYSPDTTTSYSPDTNTYYSPDTTTSYSPDTNTYYSPDTTYENGIGYSYNDYAETSYGSQSYGSSYSQPYSQQSYSQPFSFSAPQSYYPTPISYPAPQPQPQPRPVTYSQPVQQQQQQQQQQSGGQPININNVNTNTNTNVNTAPVTPVYQQPIQYPVQYIYQPQTPVYQNINCTISAAQTSLQNGQSTYLSWSASGATSAWLSNGIGTVNVNGSIAIAPMNSMTYTLTVTGQGGSNTCSVFVAVNGPSVSLSQIPYTGFDFGLLGDTMYWLALLSFAAAGAYLMIYYRGGMFALAGTMVARSAQAPAKKVQPVVTATAQKIEQVAAPVRASQVDLADLPVFESRSTSDTMSMVRSKDNAAPRIVISRA